MKTNDIKITQRAEYYYTAIDLFQTVHQNRSMLGVLGCKADAQKLLRAFFFLNASSSIFFFFCHPRKVSATTELLKHSLHLLILLPPPFVWFVLTFILPFVCRRSPGEKYIDKDFSLSG